MWELPNHLACEWPLPLWLVFSPFVKEHDRDARPPAGPPARPPAPAGGLACECRKIRGMWPVPGLQFFFVTFLFHLVLIQLISF